MLIYAHTLTCAQPHCHTPSTQISHPFPNYCNTLSVLSPMSCSYHHLSPFCALSAMFCPNETKISPCKKKIKKSNNSHRTTQTTFLHCIMIILDHPHHNQPHHPGNTVLLFSLVITLLLEQRIKSFSREIGGLRLVTGACRIVDVLLTLR